MMAHAQKPYFVFRRKGRLHLNRQGRQFSRLLAAKVCASVLVMLDTPSSEECKGYWLPTPFASFTFTSPPVRHRVPSRFNWTLPPHYFWAKLKLPLFSDFPYCFNTICSVCRTRFDKQKSLSPVVSENSKRSFNKKITLFINHKVINILNTKIKYCIMHLCLRTKPIYIYIYIYIYIFIYLLIYLFIKYTVINEVHKRDVSLKM